MNHWGRRALKNHRTTRWALLLVLVGGLAFAAACGDDEKTNNNTPQPQPDAGMDADDDQMDADEPEEDANDEPAADGPRQPGATEEEVTQCEPELWPDRTYEATIRWTSYGIPHITGSDLGNAAFGQGYAASRDHVCNMADLFIRAQGTTAMHFGPGEGDANVEYDFGIAALRIMEDARCKLGEQTDEIREVLAGYTAGYNKYLEDVGPDGLPAECAGQDWVQPIDEVTLLATYLRAAHRASGLAVLRLITSAQPPSNKSGKTEPAGFDFPDMRHLGIGSNGWAIGRDRSANGKGMVLSNTHFPWESELRWHESHLIVPGRLNAYGVGLLGSAGILMGFNENVAWTHTVSTSARFNIYSLNLVPGDPESYLYDGEPRRMTKRTYQVQVKGDNGQMETVERTLYRSHYGPILNVPPFGWASNLASTYRDANAGNTAILPQFLGMDQAEDMESFKQVFAEVHGIPWVNTMAADKDGNTFYTDASTVPNISQEGLDLWRERLEAGDLLTTAAFGSGAYLFDGSDSVFEWVDEEGTVQPGTVPFSKAPQLERTDFVSNSNDSHWLTHPEEPLEGYSPLFGQERLFLPRTQMSLLMLTETGPEAAAGEDNLFTLDELEATFFQDRTLVAERLRQEVVARCTDAAPIRLNGESVDLEPACSVLAAWDGGFRVESVGAPLWREFLSEFEQEFDAGPLFEQGFDKDNPLTTPNTLPAASGPQDAVLVALANATVRLRAAGFDVDTPLGDMQYGLKGDERIAIHGGTEAEGAFNIVDYSGTEQRVNPAGLPRATPGQSVNESSDLFEEGYLVNRGASWMMFMHFTDEGPVGRAVMSYSQSAEAASEHFADQSRLFSASQTRPILFTEEEINADPNLETLTIQTGE